MTKYKFDLVINLAAQAGVRYSIENPKAYITSNILGFSNLMECIRKHNVPKVIYASSSSVYGNKNAVPFNENDNTDNPESLYAATKISNELIAKVYTKIYNIQTIGLRFFTVYGPYGRPDMAPMLFTKAIVEGNPINVFNNGDLYRDFTYIDDIVNGIYSIVTSENKNSGIYNIGNGDTVYLMDFIHLIEKHLDKKAIINYKPMQLGDVYKTYADTSLLIKDYGYKPNVDINNGIHKFIEWYKEYYNEQ